MNERIEFEHVKNIVTKKFAEDCCEMSGKFTLGKRIVSSGFFCIALLAFNIFANYAKNNLGNGTIKLDTKNEFSYLVLPIYIWLLIIFALFLWLIVAGNIYRNKNNIKLSYASINWLVVIAVISYFMAFITSQLLISSFSLRMFYTVLFILFTVYAILKANYESTQMLSAGEAPKGITLYVMNNWKKISSIITFVWVLLVVYNLVFGKVSLDENLKQRFYGVLLGVFPILITLSSLFWSTVKKYYYRVFVLQKFSSEFRNIFEIDKAKWYGNKSKELENS